MAEGTYEFEVMRAELLGIEPPDRTVFEATQKERMAAQEEEFVTEQTKVCVCGIVQNSAECYIINKIIN